MKPSRIGYSGGEVVASNGMVAAGHRLEAEAGLSMLQKGGNAVDAAVAGAFAAELAEPAMCGIGGHGVMSIYMADTGKTTVVDFYDVAPGNATPDIYETLEDTTGVGTLGALGYPEVKDDAQSIGHTSVMVPSQVAGLCAAHERFGLLPLDQVMAPAIELAEEGVPVDRTMARYVSSSLIRRFPDTAAYLLRGGGSQRAGSPKGRGDIVVRRDLGEPLRRIASDGADPFYRGDIAEAIAADMARNGGLMTMEDLARYRPYVYDPEPYSYRDYKYVTGGNVTLLETLNILECFDLGGMGAGTTASTHLMIEAMRLGWTDTMAHVGDPRGNLSAWRGLTSKNYARRRAQEIDLARASPMVGPGDPWEFDGRPRPAELPLPLDDTQRSGGTTTRVVCMDAHGNAVALLTSLGTPFGSKVTVPGTGVLLNNSMHRLDPRPGRLNSVAPGKGMQRLTAAVLIFRDGRPLAAMAGSLSIFIGGMGLHPIVNLIDFGMGIHQGIEAHRFHPAGEAIWLDDRIPSNVQRDLADMGHPIEPKPESTEGRPWGQPLKKPEGAPLNLG